MDLIKSIDDTLLKCVNYYEFIIYKGKNILNEENNDLEYNINISKKEFYDIMNRVNIDKNIKCFQKIYKEYIIKDLIYQCYDDKTSKVISKIPLNLLELNLKDKNYNYLQISYVKTNLTIVNFPSTKDLDKNSFIKKFIFRFSSRIYLNFEISIDTINKEKNYMIYINYNHDNNVDNLNINKSINDIINIINTEGTKVPPEPPPFVLRDIKISP